MDKYDQLEVIAHDLHDTLARTFCWHCGHESSRDYRAQEVLDAFRQWVVASGDA